jgi:dipeptidyl aminopeptidase/acylaminoacyl peptidase
VLYETAGWISGLRFSPDGQRLAFLDHPVAGDDRGHVALVSLAGVKQDLTGDFSSATGLAWRPDGAAIHFTASERGTIRALRSVDLDGRLGLVAGAPATLAVHDIAADGRHLVSRLAGNRGINGRAAGAESESSLSWLDWSYPTALSDDGHTLLFVEQGEGGGAGYSVYLRTTDGAPAVRLGKGFAWDISRDGAWVTTTPLETLDRIILLPTGPGEPRTVSTSGLIVSPAGWIPGTDRFWAMAREQNARLRLWVQDNAGGPFRAISPEGLDARAMAVHPDGSYLAAADADGRWWRFPVGEGEPQHLAWVEIGEQVIRWSADGKYLFVVRPSPLQLVIDRIDTATGKRAPWLELMPDDRAGLYDVGPALLSGDGMSYVYSFRRVLSTLYVLDGV